VFPLPRPFCPRIDSLKTNRGFTLIEVVMTAGILLCGLVAVAAVFSFAVRVNATNRQMAVATSLLYDKMEELRSSSAWTTGTDSESVVVGGETYMRVWEVSGDVPRQVTVIVKRHQSELIRATTLVSPSF
jgi:Tfp pilus assembly protein PilV